MNRAPDLHVREAGPPDAPAIVFLHGVGVHGGMWHDHMAALPDYHCLAPDLPGHGRSRSIPWTSRAETAASVARIIEALPGGRAHLVGLSLGGSVALELLATRSGLLDHVVLDGCGVVASRWAPAAKLAFAALSPFVRFGVTGRLLAGALGMRDPTERAELFEQVRQVDPGSFRRAFAQAQDVRISPSLLAARCPTLIVSGARELAAMHTSSRLLAARMRHAEAMVMPGAGHGWAARHPDVHVAMIRAWLEDRPLPRELVPEPEPASPERGGRNLTETQAP
jgi:pimeloyl-ACP methyl ester carboxylesterase